MKHPNACQICCRLGFGCLVLSFDFKYPLYLSVSICSADLINLLLGVLPNLTSPESVKGERCASVKRLTTRKIWFEFSINFLSCHAILKTLCIHPFL